MRWSPPAPLGGPVLYWDLLRASRRPWMWLLRYGVAALVVCQFAAVFSQPAPSRLPYAIDSEVPEVALKVNHRIKLAGQWLSGYFPQQLVILLLAAPVIAGGALGHEKERGTLQLLFDTELTSGEIVLGKLFGRLAVLGQPVLMALPLVLPTALTAGMDPLRLLLLYLQAVVLTEVMAGAALLVGVWTRHTRDAILACYALVTVVYLGGLTLLGNRPVPYWLDPFELVYDLSSPPYASVRWGPVVIHLVFWGVLGALCLVLAVYGLRRASLGQLEQRPHRWLWAFRPRVSNDPIRWRECHVLGLAPLPWLQMVPRWLGLLGTFTFSAILLYEAINEVTGKGLNSIWESKSFDRLPHLLDYVDRGRVSGEVTIMGVVLVVGGVLVVGVRCANSIAEEKRRKTWEYLLMTPLTRDEIQRSKMWGILGAALPYLAAYLGPMMVLGCLEPSDSLTLAVVFVGVALVAIFVAAHVGIAFLGTEYEITRTGGRGWQPR